MAAWPLMVTALCRMNGNSTVPNANSSVPINHVMLYQALIVLRWETIRRHVVNKLPAIQANSASYPQQDGKKYQPVAVMFFDWEGNHRSGGCNGHASDFTHRLNGP